MPQGRVIDIINLNHRWTFRYPELERLGEGAILIVEPEAASELPAVGSTLSIRKDGLEVGAFKLTLVERRGSWLGLGIDGATPQIVREVTASWDANSAAA